METILKRKYIIGTVTVSIRLLSKLFTIFIVQCGSFASIHIQTPALDVLSNHSGKVEPSSDFDTGNSSRYADGRVGVSDYTSSDLIAKAGASRVIKNVFSNRMRLFFMVGLEGTGHHFFRVVLDDMFTQHEEFTYLKKCDLMTPYDLEKYERGESRYVEDIRSARHGMREVAVLEKMLPPEGGLAVLQGCTNGSVESAMESFPNNGGRDKVLQYPDVRMLAEVAEAEGVDLRVVYLNRSAEEILGSTTRRGYYSDENFGDIEIEWADDDSAPQPARITVTFRDTNGTAILPVVDHFGDIRTAQQHQHQEQPEMTFLDCSPLPECVHPVLPGGCTAKVFSALVAIVLILVASCVGLASGTRRIFDMGSSGGGSKKSTKADKNNKISSANGNGSQNGSRKDAHNRVVS